MPRKKEMNELKKSTVFMGVLVVALAIIALLLVYFRNLQGSTNTTSSSNFYSGSDYPSGYSDSCTCTAHERMKCSDSSWTLYPENRLCKKGSQVTNVVWGCSEYDCAGTIYQFNADTGQWTGGSQ